MVTVNDFAQLINGRKYGYEMFSEGELKVAKRSGIVIVTGASDDLIEFQGAIEDEGGCYDGGTVYFNKEGISQDGETEGYLNKIEAVWCGKRDDKDNVISWSYETDIPHETFMIYEDGEPYCEGIVFSINDLE